MHFLTFLNNSLRQFCPFLNFENVFLASEQLNFFDLKKHEKPNINHLSILAQDTWMPDVNAAIKIPHSYELKDKLFLCYNNRTAPHRCQLVSLMNSKDMIKDSFVSLNVEKAHESITNDSKHNIDHKYTVEDNYNEKNYGLEDNNIRRSSDSA